MVEITDTNVSGTRLKFALRISAYCSRMLGSSYIWAPSMQSIWSIYLFLDVYTWRDLWQFDQLYSHPRADCLWDSSCFCHYWSLACLPNSKQTSCRERSIGNYVLEGSDCHCSELCSKQLREDRRLDASRGSFLRDHFWVSHMSNFATAG